jgi:hypothetical protein
MHSRFARVLMLLAGVLAALAARAQTAVSPNHVAFYTEPNFKGDVLLVEAGASVPNLETMRRPNQQPWLFAISSIQIVGAARASVYSGVGFAGQRLDITTSVADLYALQRGSEPGATWDRAIAAIAVTGPAPAIVAQPLPPPTVVRETPPPPGTTVVVVPSSPPPGPPPVVREVRPRIDRRSAELIVQRAFRDVLNRPADPEGLRTYVYRLMNDGWSERQVIEQLQRSDEARSINPDQAITRIYREVLGRDPDPSGLATYRARWRDGWTQGQIRDDLRRSAEGRNTYIRETITRAYREVLGRDPDPAGYATYERAMRERGYTEREVRAALMASEEYRRQHPRGR